MTRSPVWFSSLSLCLVLALAGCNKQGPEPPAAAVDDAVVAPATVEEPLVTEAPPPLPEAAPNAVAVGGTLDPSGAATGAKPVYGTGDTVFASVPTAGHVAGDTVRVYWTDAAGETRKEEAKEVVAGEEFVNFEFSRADGMEAGAYNVQVDVNDVPVGIVDFTVE